MTLEELQKQVLELSDKLTELTNDNDKMKTDIQEKDKKITDLSEHNQKLFLRITDKTETPQEKDYRINDEYADFVGKELYETLTEKEKTNLHEILEGNDE